MNLSEPVMDQQQLQGIHQILVGKSLFDNLDYHQDVHHMSEEHQNIEINILLHQ